MINQALHKQAEPLDRVRHRDLRLRRDVGDASVFSELISMFVAAVEFGEACHDYPIVWVRAGQDAAGVEQVASIAVMGVKPGQNLCIEGGKWRGRYVPALLRAYPFAMAQVGADQYAVCVDRSWQGLSTEAGEPLFGADGQPTEMLAGVQQQLEQLEAEIERTRLVGRKLLDLGLLREMRFDATLPDGQTLTVDGFLIIDEHKLAALPDAAIVDLFRSGVLGLIHAHQVSLAHMRSLADLHARRLGQNP